MRPLRSNAWRPQVEGKRLLDPSTPTPSPQPWTRRAHPWPSTHPPPFAPLHPQLTDPLHETLAHLLVARSLDRREKTGHLAILILLDLEHLRAPGLNPIHQLAYAIGVRRDPRLHLTLERPPTLELLLHHLAPARAEPLLRGPQLGCLVLRQVEILLDAAGECRLDPCPQAPRLGGVALRAHAISLLCCQARRKQDGKAE